MRSENIKRVELWVLAARPPSRLENVEQVECAGLLVQHRRATGDDMLVIWLSRGLNRLPPKRSGWIGCFFVSSPWRRGCARPADCSGLQQLVIVVVVLGRRGSKSTQICGAEVPPSHVNAHNLLTVNLKVCDGHGDGGMRLDGHGKDNKKGETTRLLLFVVRYYVN